MQPLCQKHLKPENLNQMEPHYPLHAFLCEECLLVQLDEFVQPNEIFSDYAYFSSFSDSWLQHAKNYVEMIISDRKLNSNSFVIEIASNDGYLLQWFKEKGIPILGIEPAENVAEYAIHEKEIPTEIRFFGRETAELIADKYTKPHLIIGNNVLAHVPDINDFVGGLKVLLEEKGIVTIEFPHLMNLIEFNQFDTIYHEHFSYLSLITSRNIFNAHGMEIWKVEEIPTHGGSLRVYAKHSENKGLAIDNSVTQLIEKEIQFGLGEIKFYDKFRKKVEETKRNILQFLIDVKNEGKTVVGYGAPGKGNTLLNYCGISTDFIDFTVDKNPMKQNNFLPGSLIPILSPNEIEQKKPDYILILPWNLKEEIADQLSFTKEWNCQLVVPIPELKILNK
jgi:2-polyprenyl-3-methyl-5-hydroxy-6-metoxy-1,4-benzoquinol methylase